MDGVEAESGRAMWTEVMWRASVPKALERCTRRAGPPMERWTIWRNVVSVRSSGGSALWDSGICCDVPQEETQFSDGAAVCVCAGATCTKESATASRSSANFCARGMGRDLR